MTQKEKGHRETNGPAGVSLLGGSHVVLYGGWLSAATSSLGNPLSPILPASSLEHFVFSPHPGCLPPTIDFIHLNLDSESAKTASTPAWVPLVFQPQPG
jgi:hypothetical protein